MVVDDGAEPRGAVKNRTGWCKRRSVGEHGCVARKMWTVNFGRENSKQKHEVVGESRKNERRVETFAEGGAL